MIDLGVGEASYKDTWCKDPEPLVDLFLPVTFSGRMLTALLQLAELAKRQIKKSPQLESAAKRFMHLMQH